MSTNKTSDILRFPPKLIFGTEFITNITNVLDNVDFFQSFLNTLFVTVVSVLCVLFFCSLAGFTFAKFHFQGTIGCLAFCYYFNDSIYNYHLFHPILLF